MGSPWGINPTTYRTTTCLCAAVSNIDHQSFRLIDLCEGVVDWSEVAIKSSRNYTCLLHSNSERALPWCLHPILPTAYNNIIRGLKWGLIDWVILAFYLYHLPICNSLVQYWRLINKTEANMFCTFCLFYFISLFQLVDYIMFNVHRSSHR